MPRDTLYVCLCMLVLESYALECIWLSMCVHKCGSQCVFTNVALCVCSQMWLSECVHKCGSERVFTNVALSVCSQMWL